MEGKYVGGRGGGEYVNDLQDNVQLVLDKNSGCVKCIM